MIETLRITKILGGHAVLGVSVVSRRDLADSVALGLPKKALRHTAERVFHEARAVNELMYKIVPQATYKRRSRLTPAESERTERLARVIAASEYVWDDETTAHEWLTRPHPELGDKTPLQCAMSELGAREVEELLDRMFYGLPG